MQEATGARPKGFKVASSWCFPPRPFGKWPPPSSGAARRRGPRRFGQRRSGSKQDLWRPGRPGRFNLFRAPTCGHPYARGHPHVKLGPAALVLSFSRGVRGEQAISGCFFQWWRLGATRWVPQSVCEPLSVLASLVPVRARACAIPEPSVILSGRTASKPSLGAFPVVAAGCHWLGVLQSVCESLYALASFVPVHLVALRAVVKYRSSVLAARP